MATHSGLTTLLALVLLHGNSGAQALAKLTLEQAKIRSEQLSDVKYKLQVDISHADKSKDFTGEVAIDFNWKASKQPLRVDFSKGEVKSITIDGRPARYTYDKEAIQLKPELFKAGPSKLTIVYKHPYSKDGSGLYRFTDPEDKRTYLYSQFEAFDANQMFPNFDQPDLKAKFTFKVLAPKDWTVVSTVLETTTEPGTDKHNKSSVLWTFPETLPISTYVFSLVAGPYKVWEDTKFRIPLRLMARQSLARYVKAEEWLAWTRFGFDYYEQKFATPYPFLKYDQIIVPDFNAGAMENVAAVTFNERYAAKGERSARTMERNFSTLLHEMAHMWFGDLVTMKWWDDLWLNESFATYASAMALASHPDFKHAWISFHQEKNTGYYADRLSTTHPIVAEVPDTDVAGSNFDGITYGKGASWLKLLAFRIGEKDFSKGLAIYFKKHAFANSTVNDLLADLEINPDLKLQEFAKPWLHTAGLNSVELRPICAKDAKLEAVEILQSAPDSHPELRPHSMIFSLYGEAGNAEQWQPYRQIKADYAGPKTIIRITEALACPNLIVPNSSDDDFVKISWPSDQLPRIQGDLARIADPLQRTLFWESLGFALDDGEAHLEDAIRFISEQLSLEQSYAVLMGMQNLIEHHFIAPISSFADRDLRVRYAKQLAIPFQRMLLDTKTAKDFRLFAFDIYVTLLGLSEDRETLANIYQRKITYPEFILDQPRRWSVLQQLAALKDPRALALARLEQDKSDEGALQLTGIEASLLPLAQKTALIQKLMGPKSQLSRAQIRATFGNIFPPQQFDDRLAYQTTYLKYLPELNKQPEEFMRSAFLISLLPGTCDTRDDSLFEEILKMEWPAYMRQDVLERRDNLLYCRTIRMNTVSAKSG